MNITPSTITQLDITDAPGLDRIKVMLEDIEPGKGQITIVCWGLAWTSYFGGMAGGEIRQWFPTASAHYLADRMDGTDQRETLKRNQKRDHDYLVKIIIAVQAALSAHLRHELHGVPL